MPPLTGITFAITGSEKRGDEGAPLFTVRVDGVVRGQTAHSSFSLTEPAIPKTRSNMPTPNVPICHQKSHHVFLPSFLYRARYGSISISDFSPSRILATFVVARKSRKRFMTHQMPSPAEAKRASNESENAHFCQETGLNFSFNRVVT